MVDSAARDIAAARSDTGAAVSGEALAIPLGGSGEEGVLSASEAAEDQPGATGPIPGQMPGTMIEPGRALALADFSPPALSAGERLIRLAEPVRPGDLFVESEMAVGFDESG